MSDMAALVASARNVGASHPSAVPRGAILRFGAQTSIGLSAPASCCAARAKVARFLRCCHTEIAGHHDFTVAPLSRRERFFPGAPSSFSQRLVEPAASAVTEALSTSRTAPEPGGAADSARGALDSLRSRSRGSDRNLTVLLGLPGARRNIPEEDLAAVGAAVLNAASEAGFSPRLEVFAAGHAAGFLALKRALDLLHEDPETPCLVGGADSYLTPATLAELHRSEQLKSDLHRWGFVAGEAACFALLLSPKVAVESHLNPEAWVLSAASAVETVLPRGDEPILGKNLAQALRAVLSEGGRETEGRADEKHKTPGATETPARSPNFRVDQTVCDLNGERWRGEEIGFVVPRLADQFKGPGQLVTPATAFGDTGAATGPLSWALATHLAKRGVAAGPISLTFASEDGPARGAALLFTPVVERD